MTNNNNPQQHQPPQSKIRNGTLSAVLILALISFGILSLRQYYQLQNVRRSSAIQLQAFRQSQMQQQFDQEELAFRLVSQMGQLQQKIESQSETIFTKPQQVAAEAIQRELAYKLVSQVGELEIQLKKSQKTLQGVLQQAHRSENIIAQVAGGICLIQGEYRFLDPVTRTPLRYLDSGEIAPAFERVDPNDAFFPVSVTGKGDSFTVQYTGTGFLIDSGGHILTNSHITTPWKNANDYQHVLAAGYEPELILFQAFFPDQPTPFELTVLNRSEQNDVALLHANLGSAQIPVLDCATDSEDLKIGETVIVIGYPTGFDALLARLDNQQMESILGVDGLTFEEMGHKMSQQKLIWPIATRGMCSRVGDGKIVYDAQTAIGGSGAPVLGSNGQVVGINTALMKGFSGSNFGIAVSRGLELLDQLAGKQLEPLAIIPTAH